MTSRHVQDQPSRALRAALLAGCVLLAAGTAEGAGRAAPWSPAVDQALARLAAHLGISQEDLAPPLPRPPSELQLDAVQRSLAGPRAALEPLAGLVQVAADDATVASASELGFLLTTFSGGWLGVEPGAVLDLGDGAGAAAQLAAMAGELERLSSALPSLSEEWRVALAQLALDLARARATAHEALSGLAPADRSALLGALDALDGTGSPRDPLTLGGALLVGERVDRAGLARAAASLLVSADAFLQLRPPGEPGIGWRSDVPGVTGYAVGPIETAAGPLYIGGPGANRWQVRDGIIVEFSGRDRYEPPPGDMPGSIVIFDLEGNDAYVDAVRGVLGSGVFGVGLVRDLAGNDVYAGGQMTQGAAWCGVGLVVDDQGDDLYRARSFSQGAAGFGIGLLVDGAGTDTYVSSRRSQGYGTTLGAGLLADRSGDDTYRLVSPDSGTGHGRLGQGAAEGHQEAEIAGGVGVLWDAQGSDAYHAHSEAQGWGQWFAAGWLVDGNGNDTSTLDRAGQGSSRGHAVGVLVDLRGHDVRSARSGPALGSADDRGLALLVDAEGDDAATCSGTGIGSASGQAVAVYVDMAGDDAYLTRRREDAPGRAEPEEGCGSLGLFVDGGGLDRYAGSTGGNSRLWTAGHWGAGLDTSPGSLAAGTVGVPARRHPAAPMNGSASIPELSIEEARTRMDDPNPWVRVGAMRALGASSDPADAERLAACAGGFDSAWVRGAASLALSSMPPETAGPVLVRALEACASPEAEPGACAFLVRAAAGMVPPAGEPPTEGHVAELHQALESIASLGPPVIGTLVMELVFDVHLDP